MTIFARTLNLVSATLHDWLDRCEPPQQLARQSLRELADAIETATLAVARSIAAERILLRRRDEQRRQIDLADCQAMEAIRGDDDSAARAALARKFESMKVIEKLDAQIADAAAVNQRLRERLDALRDRHRRAENDLTIHSARHTVAMASRQFAEIDRGAVRLKTGFGDLHRSLERIELATLEAEVHAEVDAPTTQDCDRQLSRLRRERFVSDELERLQKSTS